jgi:hypothetical protein
MATGDTADFVGRLKAALPAGWFPQESTLSGVQAPVLNSILTGLAQGLSQSNDLISYTTEQTRISTATDVWLDIIALDYFAQNLQRRSSETDSVYSTRIRANLLAPKNTRAAITKVLQDLTGNTPIIFEPMDAGDAGGYGGQYLRNWTGLAYNYAGGYGSVSLPFQAFIVIARPLNQGVAYVGGYWRRTGWAGGGYGTGALEYVDKNMIAEQITDADIYAAVARTAPVGTIMWVAITPVDPVIAQGKLFLVGDSVFSLAAPIIVSSNIYFAGTSSLKIFPPFFAVQGMAGSSSFSAGSPFIPGLGNVAFITTSSLTEHAYVPNVAARLAGDSMFSGSHKRVIFASAHMISQSTMQQSAYIPNIRTNIAGNSTLSGNPVVPGSANIVLAGAGMVNAGIGPWTVDYSSAFGPFGRIPAYKASLAFGAAGAFSGSASVSGGGTGILAQRSRDFTSFLGVETQFKYAGNSNSPYNSLSGIEAMLLYLNPVAFSGAANSSGIGSGISFIRETYVSNTSMTQPASIGALGYKFLLGYCYDSGSSSNNGNNSAQRTDINNMINSGYVKMVEGPNEVDNFGPWANNGIYYSPTGTGSNSSGATGTAWYQVDTWYYFSSVNIKIACYSLVGQSSNGQTGNAVQTAMKANGYDYTTHGSYTGICDYGNAHWYPNSGYCPSDPNSGSSGFDASNGALYGVAANTALGQKSIISEFGLVDGNPVAGGGESSGSYNGKEGSTYVNAVYLPQSYAHGFKSNKVVAMFYYELADWAPDDGTQETHFGMFYNNGLPKGEAIAMNNLLQVVGDQGATAATFTPGRLNYSFSSIGNSTAWAQAESMLLQKANGSFVLLIWPNQTIYLGGTYTAAPQYNITINLGQTCSAVVCYDPGVNATNSAVLNNASYVANNPAIAPDPYQTTSSWTNVSSVTIGLGDGMKILYITP